MCRGKESERMKKLILISMVLAFASSVCLSMGGPPSAYNGQITRVITGEVTSVDTIKNCIRMTVVDDAQNANIIDLQYGTSDKYYDPTGKRLEVVYFVNNEGRSIALTALEMPKTR